MFFVATIAPGLDLSDLDFGIPAVDLAETLAVFLVMDEAVDARDRVVRAVVLRFAFDRRPSLAERAFKIAYSCAEGFVTGCFKVC